MTDRTLQVDALSAMTCYTEAIAAIAGDIGCSYTFDTAGLAIVAAFATDGIAGWPFLAGFGHAIDCTARAVAGITGVGL